MGGSFQIEKLGYKLYVYFFHINFVDRENCIVSIKHFYHTFLLQNM